MNRSRDGALKNKYGEYEMEFEKVGELPGGFEYVENPYTWTNHLVYCVTKFIKHTLGIKISSRGNNIDK